jgi:hypothetical protein
MKRKHDTGTGKEHGTIIPFFLAASRRRSRSALRIAESSTDARGQAFSYCVARSRKVDGFWEQDEDRKDVALRCDAA